MLKDACKMYKNMKETTVILYTNHKHASGGIYAGAHTYI